MKSDTQKTLEKFAKDFKKLLAKYPDVLIGSDINGNIKAYQSSEWKTEQVNLPSFVKKSLTCP